MYSIELTKTAEKELSKIFKSNKSLYRRILNAIESLAVDPNQGKALKSVLKGNYSYRVGSYRIIYSCVSKKLLITVIDIGHRRDVYKV
jgi:mRNA interferase RelE/StbE